MDAAFGGAQTSSPKDDEEYNESDNCSPEFEPEPVAWSVDIGRTGTSDLRPTMFLTHESSLGSGTGRIKSTTVY